MKGEKNEGHRGVWLGTPQSPEEAALSRMGAEAPKSVVPSNGAASKRRGRSRSVRSPRRWE